MLAKKSISESLKKIECFAFSNLASRLPRTAKMVSELWSNFEAKLLICGVKIPVRLLLWLSSPCVTRRYELQLRSKYTLYVSVSFKTARVRLFIYPHVIFRVAIIECMRLSPRTKQIKMVEGSSRMLSTVVALTSYSWRKVFKKPTFVYLRSHYFAFRNFPFSRQISLVTWKSNILFCASEMFSKGQKQVGLLRDSRKQLPSIMVSKNNISSAFR